jgi:hypothetical protein
MLRELMFALAVAATSPSQSGAVAAGTALTPAAEAKADSFFAALKAGQTAEAYHKAFEGTLMMQKKQGDMDNAIAQTNAILTYYGHVTGWEFIDADPLSPSFAQARYLVKTEQGPIFFRLQLYNPGTGWVISNISFADRLSGLQ